MEIKLKGLVDEDVVNYRKTSMFIIFPSCDFKCEKECGRAVCQNSSLAKAPILSYDDKEIIEENSKSLIEAIVNMKNGSVITIELEDGCVEYITRTKWFDTNLIIVGGIGRIKTTTFTFYDDEEINAEKLVKDIEEIAGEKIILNRRKTNGRIKMEYISSEVFREMETDNFKYRNNSGYSFR